MLALTQTATIRLDLPHGVVIHTKPLDAFILDLANARAAEGLASAESGSAALARYGVEASLSEHLADLGRRGSQAALAVELALVLTEAWEGVGVPTGELDADGAEVLQLAPLKPEWIAALLNRPAGPGVTMAEAYLRELWAKSMPGAAAKKGSAASPDGSGAAAGTTARTAEPSASPVRGG